MLYETLKFIIIRGLHTSHCIASKQKRQASSVSDELAKTPGFIRSERFSSVSTKNKLLSMSVCKDEECVKKWRNDPEHRKCQKATRDVFCEGLKITVATPVRTYTLTDREDAPEDSNEYFGVRKQK